MGTILAILFFGLGIIVVGTIMNMFTIWVGGLILAVIIIAALICIFVCIEHPKEIVAVIIVAIIIIMIILKIHDFLWFF